MTDRELMGQALDVLEDIFGKNKIDVGVINRLRDRLAQPEQEPVAWRDHVEQRLLTWRQSFVNRSGDQLALDDFMDKQSLDDLIDYVCDEYTAPPQRKPLTDREIELLDGMIEVQLHHAAQCDHIANRAMADKQKGWDMERVELLRKLKEKNT